MKKIFSSEAIHILPLPSGFIIATKQKEQDNHILVGYKMATLETDVLNSVTRNVYQLAKFGNNFKQYEKYLKDYLNCKTIQLPTGRLFAVYPDGRAMLYNQNIETEWSGTLMLNGYGPCDIALQDDKVWASFPESNTLIRYNLANMKEDLRIGAGKGTGEISSFSYPMGIWINGDTMLVCNANSNKIIEVNLTTFSAYDYAEFDESVMQFIKISDTEIVHLSSGIYTL